MVEVESFVLLVQEGCPGCESAKKELAKMGGEGKNIRVLDIGKDAEGAKIAGALQVREVPSFVVVQREGDKRSACLIDKAGEVGRCAELGE